MKQEFPIGAEVYLDLAGDIEKLILRGTIIDYREKGFFKSFFSRKKRYKIKLLDGSIEYSGASRITLVKE